MGRWGRLLHLSPAQCVWSEYRMRTSSRLDTKLAMSNRSVTTDNARVCTTLGRAIKQLALGDAALRPVNIPARPVHIRHVRTTDSLVNALGSATVSSRSDRRAGCSGRTPWGDGTSSCPTSLAYVHDFLTCVDVVICILLYIVTTTCGE